MLWIHVLRNVTPHVYKLQVAMYVYAWTGIQSVIGTCIYNKDVSPHVYILSRAIIIPTGRHLD